MDYTPSKVFTVIQFQCKKHQIFLFLLGLFVFLFFQSCLFAATPYQCENKAPNVNGAKNLGESMVLAGSHQQQKGSLAGKPHNVDSGVINPHMNPDGTIRNPGNNTHCTNAVCTAFGGFIKNLEQKGVTNGEEFVQLKNVYNNVIFKKLCNASGFAMAAFVAASGLGEVFNDWDQVQPGDICQRTKGKNGHVFIVDKASQKDGKVCYWSSNKATNGAGCQCEQAVTNKEHYMCARFNRLDKLEGFLQNSQKVLNKLRDKMHQAGQAQGSSYAFSKKDVLELGSLTEGDLQKVAEWPEANNNARRPSRGIASSGVAH